MINTFWKARQVKTSQSKKDESGSNLIRKTMFTLYLKESFYEFLEKKKSKI
jgi:hypothetical protein